MSKELPILEPRKGVAVTVAPSPDSDTRYMLVIPSGKPGRVSVINESEGEALIEWAEKVIRMVRETHIEEQKPRLTLVRTKWSDESAKPQFPPGYFDQPERSE